MEIRLNKFISDSGYCSRREADRFIEENKVTVNGYIAEVGDKVSSKDVVKVNGNLIESRDEYVYIALNKPVGVTSTTDSSDSTNVVDFVNYPTRIFHIGRLDKDSEGLILLTDNGDIVNKILRSSNNHEKEYEVQVDKSITPEFIEKMSNGVKILGTVTKKCFIEKEGDKHFRIILTQGLNRQIRRMCEAFGYEVVKLRRVRIMHITLNKLPLEQWRFLEEDEIKELLDSVKDSRKDGKRADSSPKRFKSRAPKEPYFNSGDNDDKPAVKVSKRPIRGGRSAARVDYKATSRDSKSTDKKGGSSSKPFEKRGLGSAKSYVKKESGSFKSDEKHEFSSPKSSDRKSFSSPKSSDRRSFGAPKSADSKTVNYTKHTDKKGPGSSRPGTKKSFVSPPVRSKSKSKIKSR